MFRINIKLLSNPVAELKIRENDSHCRSIVIKTMDRSIVKQLEKEKNSNFNVERGRGGGGGGYGLLFHSEFFFSDNTRVRTFFFVAGSANFFFFKI